jgi:hypothetical protein
VTADEIVKEVGNVFTPWKIKNTLKKKLGGAEPVLAANDGRYSLKAA